MISIILDTLSLKKTVSNRIEDFRHTPKFPGPADSGGHDGSLRDTALNNLSNDAACPAEAMAFSERAAFLRRCLQELPEKHREVVYLRFYVDESLDGIATTLDCSVGTVKSRLFHALEKLRKMKKLTEHFRENESHL